MGLQTHLSIPQRPLCAGFTGPYADNPSQRTPGVHETHTAKEELAQVSKGNRKKEGKKKKNMQNMGAEL